MSLTTTGAAAKGVTEQHDDNNDTDVDVSANYASVRHRIDTACESAGRSPSDVVLVAVSKTKPIELLHELYHNPAIQCRVFGENYAQELMQKAALLPNDVSWHFIGTLQSNKAAPLLKAVLPVCRSLTIETVSTMKLATKLNNIMKELQDDNNNNNSDNADTTAAATAAATPTIPPTLDIFVQVNTSGEGSKGGVDPEHVAQLCRDILEQCDRLHLKGLMTIGAVGDESCFDVLAQCRERVLVDALDRDTSSSSSLALSMGMSGDFETAIAMGATHVRIGSTIFGNREYPTPKE